MGQIKRLLVANRGEIALRIMRTARKMAMETVAVFSEADRNMPFVRYADYAVNIGKATPGESYLNIEKIVDAARALDCQAIHPGYGFLSENALFAQKCESAGILFVGPRSHSIEQMGDKLKAKQAVKKFDIPLVPGVDKPISDLDEALHIAENIGYPVMIKASAGGGGKGMRVVYEKATLKADMKTAMSEAQASFGDPSVFIEKFIESPRHIEVQIMADEHGNIIHLNERECSIQRRHQKVVEECPSPVVNAALRSELGKAAIDVAKACQYVGAGTVEFIMDQNKNFYFLEMNTRLQVEHPVTEFVTGLDLVQLQLEIAQGKPLTIRQEDVQLNGHAIELRVCAEDPEDNFNPSVGKITSYRAPTGDGIRVDEGYGEGLDVPIYYDPLLAKLVVHGRSRYEAIERLSQAIDLYTIEGVKTTLPFGKFVTQNRHFIEGDFDTYFISRYFESETDQRDGLLEKIAAAVGWQYYSTYKENHIALNKSATNWRRRLYVK